MKKTLSGLKCRLLNNFLNIDTIQDMGKAYKNMTVRAFGLFVLAQQQQTPKAALFFFVKLFWLRKYIEIYKLRITS